MSLERYIELLQAIITMTNPENEEQMLNARNILKNLLELARSSGMAGGPTMRAMTEGYHGFSMIMRHRENFAGKPGDYAGNQAKRHRLEMVIVPHC